MATTTLTLRSTDVPEDEPLIKLSRKLDSHIKDYEIFKLKLQHKQEAQDAMYTKNMEAIEKLTAATHGVVSAWVVANNLQRFIRWLSAFAIIGGVVASWDKIMHRLFS